MRIVTIGTYKIFSFISNTLSSFSTIRPQLSTIYGTNDAGTAYRSYNAASGGGTLGTTFKPNSGYLLVTRYPNSESIAVISNQTFDKYIPSLRIDKTYTFLTYPFVDQSIVTYRSSLCAVYGFNTTETAYRSYNASTGGGTLGTTFRSSSGYLIHAREPFDLINPEWPYTYSQTATAYDTFADYGITNDILLLTGGTGFFDRGYVLLPGIGPFDTFEIYDIGNITVLSGGQNFYADGLFIQGTELNAYDTFANYSIGFIQVLDQGIGFFSNGLCISAIRTDAYDTFANYATGNITVLNQGIGFNASGSIVTG